MVGGVIQPLIFNISAHLIWFDMVFVICNTHIIKSNSISKHKGLKTTVEEVSERLNNNLQWPL